MDACAPTMGHYLVYGLVDEKQGASRGRTAHGPGNVPRLGREDSRKRPVGRQRRPVPQRPRLLTIRHLVASRLLRYGFIDEAQRISTALLEAAGYSKDVSRT